MPLSNFMEIARKIMGFYQNVHFQTTGEGQILVMSEPCYRIEEKFGNLEFNINEARILIKPTGYLQPFFGDDRVCSLGISGIPDKLNEFRLGSLFLRNFFVGLDFENNQLSLGLNSGNLKAEITDASHGNVTAISPIPSLLFLFFYSLVLFAIKFYMKRKEKKKVQGASD